MTIHPETDHGAEPQARVDPDPRESPGTRPGAGVAPAPGRRPPDAADVTDLEARRRLMREEARRRGEQEPGGITLIVPSRLA